MAREATFTFIPASQMENHADVDMVVSYNKVQRCLNFSKKCPETMELIGKYVRFYVDTKKNTLAWHLFEKENGFEALSDLKEIKEVKTMTKGYGKGTGKEYPTSRITVQVPIAAIRSLKIDLEENYNKITVKKYKPQSLLTEQQFYYIEF